MMNEARIKELKNIANDVRIGIVDATRKTENHSFSGNKCTKCGYRFNTDYATNPYLEMINIAHGKYKFCPECGRPLNEYIIDERGKSFKKE